MDHGREAPTLAQLLGRIAELPEPQAPRCSCEFARHHLCRQLKSTEPVPPPVYASWKDYLARTSSAQRREWCARKRKVANRERLMSGKPDSLLTLNDVWAVLETARGRCSHCYSLALESRPSKPNGTPLPWASIGRRIGSLGHVVSRFHGGSNSLENLAWSCVWCNAWQSERRPGATDHGGLFPDDIP